MNDPGKKEKKEQWKICFWLTEGKSVNSINFVKIMQNWYLCNPGGGNDSFLSNQCTTWLGRIFQNANCFSPINNGGMFNDPERKEVTEWYSDCL